MASTGVPDEICAGILWNGDVEPVLAVGREVQGPLGTTCAWPSLRLGYLAESVGITAVPCGPPLREFWDHAVLGKYSDWYRNFWTIGESIKLMRGAWAPVNH